MSDGQDTAPLLKESIDRIVANDDRLSSEEVIRAIYDLVRPLDEAGGDALLERHPELFNHRPSLTKAYHDTVVGKEIAELERILPLAKGPATFADVASPRAMITYDRVSEMFSSVDFRSCRRLVMVGCGRVPAAVFHVHDRTEVPEIIGLDVLSEAIDGAKALLGRLGYRRARTEISDGSTYDYAGIDVVLVANMVSPKPAVVSRIADTASANVRIVVRDPLSLGRLWADSVERALDPRLEILGKGDGIGHWSLSRDLYLKRKGTGG